MFVSPVRFSAEDLAFFSGFVAGDGSFAVRPNNAGTSWCCSLEVKLRADDTPLLAAFRDWSGAGELFQTPARGGSHPQTAWHVGRRRDCLEITRILGRRPPLGKAGLQFDLWRQAVEVWHAEGGSSAKLPAFAARLRELHRSANPVPCRVHITESQLVPWLAGFASAEAHFGVSAAGSPAFVLNLRADDEPLLRLLQRTLGMGVLRDLPPAGGSQAAVRWHVCRRRDLRRLVALFDMHGLRGRAAYVYSAWREVVMFEHRMPIVRRALAVEIRRRRRFATGRDDIERKSVAERRRRRCEDALRGWSRSDAYPGSGVDYERWRRTSGVDAPTRNTIAAAFGSWREALEAVGLDTARSQSRERIAALRAGSSRNHAARRARSREAVLAAVCRCIEEIGHEPGATEFLRWRAANAPDSPSQMTIYRSFPGGFAQVLAAARAEGTLEDAA